MLWLISTKKLLTKFKYENFKNNFAEIYKSWGLKVPKLIILDASGDISSMPDLAEHCERIIIESFKEKFPLKTISKEDLYY